MNTSANVKVRDERSPFVKKKKEKGTKTTRFQSIDVTNVNANFPGKVIGQHRVMLAIL